MSDITYVAQLKVFVWPLVIDAVDQLAPAKIFYKFGCVYPEPGIPVRYITGKLMLNVLPNDSSGTSQRFPDLPPIVRNM